MNVYHKTPFQKALDAVEALSIDEREKVIKIIKKRIAEDRRNEIVVNDQKAVEAIWEHLAKYGTVEELKEGPFSE